MISKTMRGMVCGALTSLALSAGAGEAATPEPVKPVPPVQPVQPVQPVKPQPPVVNPQQIVDWKPYLDDFTSADAARQQAATKTFIESGSRGYMILGNLLKNPNADIVKRANDVRNEIDQRSLNMYRELDAKRQKAAKEPLTPEALDVQRQEWIKMAMYASQNALKQFGFQTSQELQKQIDAVKAAQKQLADADAQMKAGELKGLQRASVQIDRAQALKTLQRDADSLAAVQDALTASGKEGRLTPSGLKLLIEIYQRAEDAKNIEATCRRIIAEYPRSLEIKFAYKTLSDQLMAEKKFDDAFTLIKAYVAAFPIDEEAQDTAYSLMETLMNDEQDYKRVGPVTDWLIETMPLDRLRPETAKLNGGCNEYIVKDYAKAIRGYTLLRDKFADMVSADDMTAALARLTAKMEGKFPKEPNEGEAGPAGAFATFLKAIRTKDVKLIATVVPKEDAEEVAENLGDGSDDRVPALTFSDFAIKKVDIDEKGQAAKIQIDYYEAGSNKPRAITEPAVLEEGKWKIAWQDPDEAEGGEISTKIPVGPAVPGVTPILPQQPKK